jgi:hypothetical protein
MKRILVTVWLATLATTLGLAQDRGPTAKGRGYFAMR